jgi:hypothetical protein
MVQAPRRGHGAVRLARPFGRLGYSSANGIERIAQSAIIWLTKQVGSGFRPGTGWRFRESPKKAHRPGLYQCNECREQFTVTVGSVMEDSKIPLNKWLLAMHFLGASKKGMSAHQLHRMLGITYQSAWFLAHRIREAMTDPTPSPIGGADKVIEADESYVGGKAKNRAHKPEPKNTLSCRLSSAAVKCARFMLRTQLQRHCAKPQLRSPAANHI